MDDDLARPAVGRAPRSTAAPSGSASATARSPRCAPTTTPDAKNRSRRPARLRPRRPRLHDAVSRHEGPPERRGPAAHPAFTEEHEELRAGAAALRRDRAAPARARSGRTRGGSPTRSSCAARELGYLGLKYEEKYGGQGGGYVADAVWTEELARCGSGGAGGRASARTRRSPRRRSGSSAPRTRSSATSCPRSRARRSARSGSPSPTPAPTSPASARAPSASTAATSSTARRRSSPTACAPTSSSPRSRRHRRAATTASRSSSSNGRGLQPRASSRSSAGTPRTPATIAFEDVFVPEENLLGELNRGFYLIMANFQWERLLMALGAVGAMQSCSSARSRTRTSAARSAARSARFQVTRHKIAEIAVRSRPAARSPTTRCGCSSTATTPCAR